MLCRSAVLLGVGLEQGVGTPPLVALLALGERVDERVHVAGGLPHLRGEDDRGVQADDVIATLTTQAVDAGMDVLIVTGDRDAYQLVGPHVVPDAVLLIKGRLDKSEEEAPKLIAMEVSVPDLSTGEQGPVVVTIPASRCIPPVIDRFKEVLAAHPGVTEVRLALALAVAATAAPTLDGDAKDAVWKSAPATAFTEIGRAHV